MTQDFLESVTFEIRITVGENWNNYVAKSQLEPLLKTLTNSKIYDRNTETNEFQNVKLYTDALQKFNLRINVGLNM